VRSIDTDRELKHLETRVLHYAETMGRTLPEIRFFILDSGEFGSLLEKHVYPQSPINIWEGKNMITKRFRIDHGLESSIYYEVVQTGEPSYAYLNDTNSAMTQASVMAHVIGHCEFSQLNVMQDSSPDRTEMVIHLVRKANSGRRQMGERNYMSYWNACESVMPMIAPNSQFNLDNSVLTESAPQQPAAEADDSAPESQPSLLPFSSTLDGILNASMADTTRAFKQEIQHKMRQETLSRKGYKLVAPCQDVIGFLRQYAPASRAERAVLDYMYTVHAPHDFVIRTQIMNEGWAMYWEKKLMLELFKEKAVAGIIDYARIFSGVCYPRPYFMRNPYHLGYHLWNHIEELYRDGKVTLDYLEETDLQKKENWSRPNGVQPVEEMEHLVRTITDYEFLRRFLTADLIEQFHLNRIARNTARQIGVKARDVIREDSKWVWLEPHPVKDDMLNFFTHFNRPRIYAIDCDFLEGGMLLYHRNDGRNLRKEWIKPTMKNLNMIWKAPVYLLSKDTLYGFAANRYQEKVVNIPEFNEVAERLRNSEKAFTL